MSSPVGSLLVRAWHAQRDGDPQGVYDEVLHEVSHRASAKGSLGKADIGALVMWKRITAQARWTTKLLLTPDREVRAITEQAYAKANDNTFDAPEAGQAGRLVLLGLAGMGGTGALASAVLLALAPDRMAVWDRRVGTSLSALGRHPGPAAGSYGRYLTTLTALANEMNASAHERQFLCRDVDLALFFIAGSEALMPEARRVA